MGRLFRSNVFRVILLVIGIIATVLLAVFSGVIFSFLGVPNSYEEMFVRAFSFLNGIFLTIFGLVGARQLRGGRLPEPTMVDASMPVRFETEHRFHAEPCKFIAIERSFPSFSDRDGTIRFIKSAVIAANYKPLMISDAESMQDALRKGNVCGLIADASRYEEVIRICQQIKNLTPVFVGRAKAYSRGTRGGRIEIKVNDGQQTLETIYDVADALSGCYSLDTPRGVGFHGNWCGTYGMMALHQRNDFSVDGKYWYGAGGLEGTCEIDVENERCVLQYRWSQTDNPSAVGSKRSGVGVFVLPAGYEFLYGYWYSGAEIVTSQTWCAARLSKDISDDIRQDGAYSRDFGLAQHPASALVAW
jgi:hypothetical protein